MPKDFLIIQDNAVIALSADKYSARGEALKKYTPERRPLTPEEWQRDLGRLESSLCALMDKAQATHEVNCHQPGTLETDPEYITRFSTNEFFFFTEKPLSLPEFEDLQNRLAEKAKTLSPGVQLIFGSFAVQTHGDDGQARVMNVTPHITCGDPPEFHFLVKNYSSPIDVTYKDPETGRQLPHFDSITSDAVFPTIRVNGVVRHLTLGNLISCKTPGGTPFITAIDICRDHNYGLAKENHHLLQETEPAKAGQPVSHVVISNSTELQRDYCIGPRVMHVDTHYSLPESESTCKQGIPQRESEMQQLPFGDDFVILQVDPEKFTPSHSAAFPERPVFSAQGAPSQHATGPALTNNYAHKTTEAAGTRRKDRLSVDDVQFLGAQGGMRFYRFKNTYSMFRGDDLKTRILEYWKIKIEAVTSLRQLDIVKHRLRASYDIDVLLTGQSPFTRALGLKTSAVRALQDLLKQKERQLSPPEYTP